MYQLAPSGVSPSGGRRPFPSDLLALSVHADAVIAKPITARSSASLILWDVTAWRTRAVVVVDAVCGGFSGLVYRIKLWHSWHLNEFPFGGKHSTAP